MSFLFKKKASIAAPDKDGGRSAATSVSSTSAPSGTTASASSSSSSSAPFPTASSSSSASSSADAKPPLTVNPNAPSSGGHGSTQTPSAGGSPSGASSSSGPPVDPMPEEKVSEEVVSLRKHFASIPALSKRIFSIGDTLGTGTFGRVRLVAYTPPTATAAAASTGTSPATSATPAPSSSSAAASTTTTSNSSSNNSSSSSSGGGVVKPQYFALKMLKKSEIIRLKQVEHIKAEKSILSRICHPFIVNLFCHFQDDLHLFMVMEYVIGGELFSQLRKVGRFSNDTSRFYAAEIVLALQYLHSKDIVYRDLNFGFAKQVEDRTWTLCGTPEYLAPEIIQSKGHGKAVDWWALGILIYEMLAGYPPFYDENPFGIYQKILAGKIDFPKHFDPYAKDLVKKLLTADRTKRFGCLKDGADDIKRHKWFKHVDWMKVFQRKVKPPYVPGFASANDTSNFDKYPDSDPQEAAQLSQKEKEQFVDF